jgi:hypothetical protein
MRGAFAIGLLLASAGCSRHKAPPEHVDPAQLENFVQAQEAALNKAEADEAAENAAVRRKEIDGPEANAAPHGP